MASVKEGCNIHTNITAAFSSHKGNHLFAVYKVNTNEIIFITLFPCRYKYVVKCFNFSCYCSSYPPC